MMRYHGKLRIYDRMKLEFRRIHITYDVFSIRDEGQQFGRRGVVPRHLLSLVTSHSTGLLKQIYVGVLGPLFGMKNVIRFVGTIQSRYSTLTLDIGTSLTSASSVVTLPFL